MFTRSTRSKAAKLLAVLLALTLFATAPSPVEDELRSLDLDNMTPIDALLKLKELKEGL